MKLSKITLRGRETWMLDLGIREGRRRRQFFAEESEAVRALKAAQRDDDAVGRCWASIPARERTGIVEAVEQI